MIRRTYRHVAAVDPKGELGKALKRVYQNEKKK